MFDSTKKIHHFKVVVHVTQRDIDDSDCRDARSCMIRNATERELRKIDTSVSHHHTRVGQPQKRYTLRQRIVGFA